MKQVLAIPCCWEQPGCALPLPCASGEGLKARCCQPHSPTQGCLCSYLHLHGGWSCAVSQGPVARKRCADVPRSRQWRGGTKRHGNLGKHRLMLSSGHRAWRQGCQLASSFLKPPGCLADVRYPLPKQFLSARTVETGPNAET